MRERRLLERDERHLAVPAVMIDGGVVRDLVHPGGEGDTLVLELIEAGQAAGHGIDGQILRILGPAEAGVDIVVDAVEVALIEGAGRVLVPFAHPLDEWAIVIARRLTQCAHWVTLWAVPRSIGGA